MFCEEVLAWQEGVLRKPDELTDSVAVSLEDYDEVLRADWIVPEPSQEEQPLKAQLLVQELPLEPHLMHYQRPRWAPSVGATHSSGSNAS